MLDHTAARWMIGIVVALAIIALLAFARGDEDGIRRDPDNGTLGAPALVHATTAWRATGA
jgi:hypothetical protein